MKNKLLKIWLPILLLFACLVSFGACISGNQELESIQITEKTYRESVYLNKEYDVMDIVENKDDDAEYKIVELFYLDSKLDRFDMEYDGTKFTQSAPYDVYVTLRATKGGASTDVEFVVEFAIDSNATSNNFINSWADEGIVRMLVANPDYLFNGATFGIKISYVGERQTVGNAAEIGGIYEATDDMSKTSWDNVVLTADVYNPQEYDLELGIIFKKANEVWTNDGSFPVSYYNYPQRLKAKECTTVAWSLKALNIQRDIFAEEVSLSIKCRIADDFVNTLSAPYSYSFVLNNFDIADYSQEKFPNLNTTFEAPIVMDNGASATFNDSYKDGVVTREATTETEYLHDGAEFAFKVGVNRPADKAKDLIGIVNSTQNCAMTSWDNVVFTADVYNTTDRDLEIGLLFVKNNQVWLNDGKIENSGFLAPITLTAGEWTTAAWSMKSFGVVSNVFDDEITVYLQTRIKDTTDMTAPYVYSLALANLDFVDYDAESFPDMDTSAPVLAEMDNGASESFRDSYKDGVVTRELSTDANYLHNGSTFAFEVGVNRAADKAQDLVGIVSSATDCSLTNWEHVVLTADVYNATDYDLEMGVQFVKNNESWLNDGKIESVSFLNPITLTAGEWTTVAWSMKVFSIGSDIFADGVDIYVKTRIKDKTGLTAPYVYDLAITNLDFVDYAAEKFPDLNLYHGTAVEANKAKNTALDNATAIETISFEYCITSGTELLVALRKDSDDNNKYGQFSLTATGEKEDYAGITVTSLGNGYNRVVITLDEITKTTGTPPAKAELNVLSFQRQSSAAYYYANVQVTHKSAV